MPINKQLSTKKTFSYSKGDVSLSFELAENEQYYKDFSSLLCEALKDIKSLYKKSWH